MPDFDNCRASISGICLQITEGKTACTTGQCEIGDWNDAMAASRPENMPKRAERKPVRGRIPVTLAAVLVAQVDAEQQRAELAAAAEPEPVTDPVSDGMANEPLAPHDAAWLQMWLEGSAMDGVRARGLVGRRSSR